MRPSPLPPAVLLAGATMALAAVPLADSPEEARKRREAIERYRDGQAFMRAESWERAESEFRAAIRLDPLLLVAHYDLGQALMAMKRFPEAVDAYLACRQAFHDAAAQAASDGIRARERREDQVRALRDDIRELEHVLRGLPPVSAQAQAVRSRIQRAQMQIDQLERLRWDGRDRAETPPELSLALGSAYLRAGRADDAEREYQAALEVNPKFGEVHNNLAVVYMLAGRIEAARHHLERAEKSGFRVNPGLKHDLDQRAREGRPR